MRPHILINFAITADGKTSTVNKDPAHFTSKADLDRLLCIRKRADAILVGRGTLEADNMSMTIPAEYEPEKQPLRCVVSRSGKFNLGHKIFHSDGGAIHLLATGASENFDSSHYTEAGATFHSASLSDFLVTLKQNQGVESLLCEGGGSLVRALAELDAIDEINLTWAGHTLFGGAGAPNITGGPEKHLPASLQYELEVFEPQENGEVFLTYKRLRA